MFINVNKKGERVIYDGEALDYECLECGNKFERLIDYGCCCPNESMRKKILEAHPTTCPECNSSSVERIRSERHLAFMEIAKGRKLYEWEN